MHRPKKIITTDETIYDAILAELSDLNEMTAATYAHNVVARLKEKKELQNAASKIEFNDDFPTDDDIDNEIIHADEERFAGKVSDITGFPEDDLEDAGPVVIGTPTRQRRIPGIPKDHLL